MTARETGWGWAARLAGFVGLFVACALVLAVIAGTFSGSYGGPDAAALVWWTVVPGLAAGLAATWLLLVRIDGRRLSWLGLRGGVGAVREVVLGSLAGFAIVGVPVLVLAGLGWASWTASAEPSAWAGVGMSGLLLVAAFTEELLFRGYPFRVLEARFGPVAALVATSAAFGLAHGANPGIGPLAFVNLGLAGVLLGVAYWRTRSLWFAGGVHFGWNWLMAASGLSVSGLDVSISGLDAALSGPPLWTGGAFGPEGGLLVTFVTVLGTAWLWRVGGSRDRARGPSKGET
ncbi:CPBP family intramembrane glutamic endopeptidase [Candidatus Palauibacter sp.]|uniref:CPBP family intramembrane glutamic endopeptidase n=1 Tax=Candidatus Palauibacter sp. TaxID=3101350 RepID=UPI003B01D7F3